MKYEMVPVIESGALEEALILKFGPEVMGEEKDFIASVLFDDDYHNYSCHYYNFEKDEVYEGKSWQNEERIRICSCVNALLRDTFPGYKRVLIDVSW